jgi:enolase
MINVFDLARYTLNLFEHEALNICGSIDSILSEKFENDWNNPIFHAEPETPKPWVEYYRQLTINGELLTIDDPVFKNHWKEYHSWADEWDCDCKEDDKTEWCYCSNNESSEKCSQW